MHAMANGRARVLPAPFILSLILLAAAGLFLAGCGHGRHHDEGYIVVDNRTDLTTDEFLLAFRVAPFGEPFTGDLLSADLAPGSAEGLGRWHEDYYDGEADLELGQLVEWFDLFVGNGDTTVFEAR